ncbi:MAG: serine/threonine protein kinase [Deltaproteobacteria bacterium]|nr:serine/threonine protein kinase [Deltaproteobacteria bacterium]
MREPPQIDRYEILGELGKGANGIVYLGRDTRLGREVAIKVVNPSLVRDPVVLARFHREAKAVSKLNHPNIIQLIDYSGPGSRSPYLVVERLLGKNLDDLVCERQAPIDAFMAAAAVHQICLGLQHAHSQGLVHRDLKPENVFVEPDGRIVLCDFGIARSFDGEEKGTLASHNTRLAGSPLYMSPEQIATPGNVGPASDMFSLGSLLFFLVTGRHAFMTDSVVNVLKRILAAKPESLRELRPGLPDRFYRIVDKLHQQAPEKRYTSAQAIADSLTLVLKETGAPDPKKALQTQLQKLGQATQAMSKSQIVALDDLDVDSQTVISSLTGAHKLPAEGAAAASGAAAKPRTKEAERTTKIAPIAVTVIAKKGELDVTSDVIIHQGPGETTIENILARKRKRSLQGAESTRQTTLLIVVGILAIALLASLLLIVTSKRRAPPPLAPIIAPAIVNNGTLRLTTQPTADVYVDERKIGNSASMGPVPLPPGTHRLRLVHPKLGKHEESFEVAAGMDTTLNIDLRKKK